MVNGQWSNKVEISEEKLHIVTISGQGVKRRLEERPAEGMLGDELQEQVFLNNLQNTKCKKQLQEQVKATSKIQNVKNNSKNRSNQVSSKHPNYNTNMQLQEQVSI